MTNARGIDTSSHNGDIRHALAGCDFAIARASIGNGFDPAFAADLNTMQSMGLVTGAYHYATYGPGPTRQAALFIRHAADAEFLVIDAESTVLRYPKTIRAIIANTKRLDPRHRKVGLYSSEGTWPGNLGQDFNWVANWSHAPTTVEWRFWQYKGSPLDRDEYHGTRAQLETWLHG